MDALASFLPAITSTFLLGVLNVIFIDLILAGDNALVIALAVRQLAPEQKKGAVWWGTLAAAALRLFFLAIAAYILHYPWVRAVGGLYIVYIAIKLLRDELSGISSEKEVRASGNMAQAVWIIVSADVAMSLDNVLAVAAVAHGNFSLLVAGIIFSVPIMIFASNILSRLMQRFPIIIVVGSLMLAWVGAVMFTEDTAIAAYFHATWWTTVIPAAAAFTVLGYYVWHLIRHRNAR